ncbi:MAG: glycosyltransferase family 2 protein [Deltaproteobacteria bacterium]|nr:glycosyltransferase family 2 protein [Deltaproteobacteria bacterium]
MTYDPPLISLVILSWNRRAELARTLGQVLALGYRPLEVIVVDNGSADGTPELVRAEFPAVRLVALPRNRGARARNHGLALARGELVVMLDDDSTPLPGSLERLAAVMAARPRLGAAAFRVRLPGGQEETGGHRTAFVGCGVGFRTGALREVGGYPRGYRYYVEEYDVSFRLLARGWQVGWFGDLEVLHRQAAQGRDLGRIIRYLTRNNLWLWPRFLPLGPALAESLEVTRRYWRVARREGVLPAWLWGTAAGLGRLPLALATRRLLPRETWAQILGDEIILKKMRQLADKIGEGPLGLVNYTRDTRRYLAAARQAGITVEAVFDPLLAGQKRAWRGAPVRPLTALPTARARVFLTTNPAPGAHQMNLRAWQAGGYPGEVLTFFPYEAALAAAAALDPPVG